MNTSYMFNDEMLCQYVKMENQSYQSPTSVYLKYVDKGIILPCKASKDRSWGRGGCLNGDRKLVPESTVTTSFGGEYDISREEIACLAETVVYIPVIPNHWGHFLIDSVCRCWFTDDENLKNFRIAYCGYGWGDNGISGNFLQMLNLLGISESRLIYITRPTQFDMVIIPCRTLGFAVDYGMEYIGIIRKAVDCALLMPEVMELKPKEKIYFTRTKFEKSRRNEVGEDLIEELFRKNGYEVMSPERMTVIEQIYYIHNCREMASLSGTIPHNIIFGSSETKLIIINRQAMPNHPQFRINQLFDVNCLYIDAYNRWSRKHPLPYGQGPICVEINDNVRHYAEDNGWKLPRQSLAERTFDKIRFWLLIFMWYLRKSFVWKCAKHLLMRKNAV